MILFVRYSVLLAVITIFSCNNSGYKITGTKETTDKKSAESYVEGILVMDNDQHDTLWHFKFFIPGDHHYFKTNPAFNVGLAVQKERGTLGSLSITYQRVSGKEPSDSLTYTQTGTLSTFTNYKAAAGKAMFTRNVSLSSDDNREDPITSTLLTNTNDMKIFLGLFEKEIRQSLRNGNRVKYISSASYNANATSIEMIVTYN